MKHLLWLDLETTGLDPQKEQIIEIAMVATDRKMNIIGVPFQAILHMSRGARTYLTPTVYQMHHYNGLIKEAERSHLTPFLVIPMIQAWAREQGITKPRPMAGTNPHFDRAFLRHHLPSIESSLFHYRSFDMNTLRFFFGAKRPVTRDDHQKHRALADLFRDIGQLREIMKRRRTWTVRSSTGTSAPSTRRKTRP